MRRLTERTRRRGGRSRPGEGIGRRRHSQKRKRKEVDIEKLQYARLKDFYRALKKAKQFEVAKVVRRLKANSKDASKFAQQLAAAKNANLTLLTNELAAKCGWKVRLKPQQDEQPVENTSTACTDEHAQSVVNARLLSAKCVKEAVKEGLESISAHQPKVSSSDSRPDSNSSGAVAYADDLDENATSPRLATDSDCNSDHQPGRMPEALIEVLRNREDAALGEVVSAASGSDSDDNISLHATNEAAQVRGQKRKRNDQRLGHEERPAKRPGQRTRRKIYEKLYGKDAAHLKAVQTRTHADVPGAQQTDAAAEDYVHPSWAAKQREKELSAARPQGKKIVFGDDEDTAVRVKCESPSTLKSQIRTKAARVEPVSKSWVSQETLHIENTEAPAKSVIVKECGERAKGKHGGMLRKLGAPGQLHPSWEASKLRREAEAKQRQALLAAPGGQKVKFDSDDE